MNIENRNEILEVLNGLEVVETGSEGYILVYNSPEAHSKLNALGVASETINKYGDGETFCIIALSFAEGYANDFNYGKLIYSIEEEEEEVYKYFISYSFHKEDAWGFGNVENVRREKFKDISDLNDWARAYEEESGITTNSLVVLSFNLFG